MARKKFEEHETDGDMVNWFEDLEREALEELGTPEAKEMLEYLDKQKKEAEAEDDDEDDEK